MKKSLAPVVATSLLVVIGVVTVVGFQGWFTFFQTSTFNDIETKTSQNDQISIKEIIGETLYVNVEGNHNIITFVINADNGSEMCRYSNTGNYSEQGLIGYWSFDNSNSTFVPDDLGNGRDGSLLFDAQPATGYKGQGIELDGVQDSVEIILTGNYYPTLDEITTISWVKPKAHTSTGRRIIQFFNGDVGYHTSLSAPTPIANRYQTNFVNNGGGSAGVVTANTYQDGKWSMFTSRSNSTIRSAGINLPIENFGSVGVSNLDTSNMDLYFGNSDSFSFISINGTIDEFKLYNRSLTDKEIEIIYVIGNLDFKADSGTSRFQISPCNLAYNHKYDVAIITSKGIFDKTLISN